MGKAKVTKVRNVIKCNKIVNKMYKKRLYYLIKNKTNIRKNKKIKEEFKNE